MCEERLQDTTRFWLNVKVRDIGEAVKPALACFGLSRDFHFDSTSCNGTFVPDKTLTRHLKKNAKTLLNCTPPSRWQNPAATICGFL